jgi:DMSO/TMAO reductase YedYZ heme-binding membrane subunit
MEPGVNPQFWWYVARATGLVAWGLSTAAVLWGLFLHTRALGRKPTAPWLLDLHRHLGALTVLFVLAHMGALVADGFVHFGWAELLVPFASPWQPGAVALGVVAFYGLLAVEITSLLKKRISKTVWVRVHLTSYVTFALATAHGIWAGTDMGNRAVQVTIAIALLALVFFLAYRQLPGARLERPATGAPGGAQGDDRAVRLAALRARTGSGAD